MKRELYCTFTPIHDNLGERNDCIVRSLMTAANTKYEIAHYWARIIFKREIGKGVIFDNSKMMSGASRKLLLEDGYRIQKVNTKKPNGLNMTINNFINNYKIGNYILILMDHAISVCDGEVCDWEELVNKNRRKVIFAYRIIDIK